MKYTLVILMVASVSLIRGQSIVEVETRLRLFKSTGAPGYDTMRFRSPTKYAYADQINRFEYPIHGKTVVDHFPLSGVKGDLVIQSSLRKGGGYTDPVGQNFGYGIFWYRVTNHTDASIEIDVNFPAIPLELNNDFPTISDSLSTALPSSYTHIYVPPDTMSIDKTLLYDYGATGLKSFLDTGLHLPTRFRRTIKAGEEVLFYIGTLDHQLMWARRAELVMKGEELFLSVNGIGSEGDFALVPAGRINIQK